MRRPGVDTGNHPPRNHVQETSSTGTRAECVSALHSYVLNVQNNSTLSTGQVTTSGREVLADWNQEKVTNRSEDKRFLRKKAIWNQKDTEDRNEASQKRNRKREKEQPEEATSTLAEKSPTCATHWRPWATEQGVPGCVPQGQPRQGTTRASRPSLSLSQRCERWEDVQV